MAQTTRSGNLEKRSNRLKLDKGVRHFVTIGEGLALAYRRTASGYGTWQARYWDGNHYHYENLGTADDYQDAEGVKILTYWQAHDKARRWAEQSKEAGGVVLKPITVAECATRYLDWFREHRKSPMETAHAINTHIVPKLGNRLVGELRAPDIRNWLNKLASTPARIRTGKTGKAQRHKAAPKTEDQKRARRATANRVLSSLKAMLNMAFRDGLVANDVEWRKVAPFEKVEEARIRFLTDAEAVRLVNACPDDLRALVRAALLTGARFGELVTLQVKDVNIDTAQVYISPSKSGRSRHIPLNDEGLGLLRVAVTGKVGEELVFPKASGEQWGKNHHVRPLKLACVAARIVPALAFHELRHTYASHLAQAGVDLLTISKLIGHADTRITSKHYAHLADKTLAAAVTKLPNFSIGDKPALASVLTQARETAARSAAL